MSTLCRSLPNLCRGGKWVWHSTSVMGVLSRSQLVKSSLWQTRTYALLQCDNGTFSKNLLRRYFHLCSRRYDTRHTKSLQERLHLKKGYLIRWTASNNVRGKDVTKALPKTSEVRRLLSIAKAEKWKIAGNRIKTVSNRMILFILDGLGSLWIVTEMVQAENIISAGIAQTDYHELSCRQPRALHPLPTLKF